MTEANPFDDPKEIPRLSCDIADKLLNQSPLHAYTAHRLLGNQRKPSTDSQRDGQLWHDLILAGGENLAVGSWNDWRSNDAKAFKAEALLAGKHPVPNDEKAEHLFDGLAVIQRRLRDEWGIGLDERGRIAGGSPEVRVEWEEEGEHGPVHCSGRIDWLAWGKNHLYDVKTTKQGNTPEAWQGRLWKGGGVMQPVAYPRSLIAQDPDLAGRVRFEWILVETTPPYSVIVAEPAGTLRELAEVQWFRAVQRWETCLRNDEWPGPAEQVVQIDAPTWEIKRALLEEEADTY